jgi:hypothetical protein
MTDASRLLEQGIRKLAERSLPEGGFGYRANGQPFVEPTALALLALAPPGVASVAPSELVTGTLATLLSWQRTAGFFGATPEDPDPSWATSPALLALLAHGQAAQATAAATWLAGWTTPSEPVSERARREFESILQIDVAIPAWPWQAGEFLGAVEPTALASIALRAWGGPGAAERIDAAMRYFEDRECKGGGWNYGNPYFKGDPLPPITLPTAKGLLAAALCGKSAAAPLTNRAVAVLTRHLENNPSRKAHAWGALAFAALDDRGHATQHAQAAVDPGDGHGAWGGSPDATALALLALRAARGDAPRCLSAGGA